MRPGLTQLWTIPAGGGAPDSLSNIASMSPAVYSYTVPGGCDQMTATMLRPPRFRTRALDTGRTLLGIRGGTVVWSGQLDEPAPSGDGWGITGHGAGAFAADYNAIWTGTWGTGVFDNAVNAAITRGMPWVNPGIGAPAGIWTGQQVDSGSQKIADLLNLGCTKGGLTWQVTTGPGGQNVLSVLPLPTTPNRILVTAEPATQASDDAPNALYLRYQSAADAGNTKAAYSLTSVTRPDTKPRLEDFTDLSSGGVLTAGSAQSVGSLIFKRYTRAPFTDPFTARYGQLLNMGGAAADPGCFFTEASPMVVQLMLADFTASGEINPGPVRVMIGAYEWDDAALTATLTPFESLRSNYADLSSSVATTFQPRVAPTVTKKKGK